MKKSSILAGGIVLVLVAAYFFYQYQLSSSPTDGGNNFSIFSTWDDTPYKSSAKKDFVEIYKLTPDSVAENGVITVNLPEEIQPEDAKEKITFTPDVPGKWLADASKEKVFFKPEKSLSLDKFYAVTLSTDKGQIKNDFVVQKDPEIIAIIPNAGTETDETSDISILFNRPMVPLSSIDKMNEADLPIEITPKTKGNFKWIGTKTLQFIPEDRLFRSANYEVKVTDKMESLDRVSIKPFSHKFQTRILRYGTDNDDSTLWVYNKPMVIKFNQPFDLEKTKKEITIKNQTTGKEVDFIAEYGKSEIYNDRISKFEEQLDESVLFIWQKKDNFNRAKFWDFNTSYNYSIKKAVPKEGDIELNEEKSRDYNVRDVISSFTAYSPATSDSFPELFDPNGTLEVLFFEDIDINSSKISSEKIKEIKYGEICESKKGENGEEIIPLDDPACKKKLDNKKIEITFKSELLKNDEVVTIKFEAIKNKQGQILNAELINKDIKIIPELKVLQVYPKKDEINADLKNIVLCTNTPLAVPKDGKSKIKSNVEYLYNGYSQSIYIYPGSSNDKCADSSFRTDIDVSFHPEKNYEMTLNLENVFASKFDQGLKFQTRKLDYKDLNFYHFQKPYNVTTPKQTVLNYASQNMNEIDLHICKVSTEKMINFTAKPIDFILAPNDSDCIDKKTDKITLPIKYWEKNYFTLDLKKYYENPIGHFVLTFSNPLYKYDRNGSIVNIYERTYLSVSDLSVVQKNVANYEYPETSADKLKSDFSADKIKDLFWVTGISTLQGISGAKISVYEKVLNKDGSSYLRKRDLAGETDKDGILRAGISTNLVGVAVSKGEDSAIVLGGYENNNDWTRLSYGGSFYKDRRIFLYTDRPIYRLNQEIFVKGIYRNGYDGEFNVPTDESIPIIITNSQNEMIYQTAVSLTSFGTFSTKFTLPKNGPTGQYNIQAKDYIGYAYFDVEDYKPATFQVDTKVDKEEYLAGDEVTLDINAKYYFGVPLEGGDIEYSIMTQNYYFDKYKDEYFNFGNDFYECTDNCYYGDKFILRDKAKLDDKGLGKVNFKIDYDKWFQKNDERTSKIVVLQTTVMNKNGEGIADQKSFIVHAGDFYLGVTSDNSFIGKDESLKLRVKSVDTKGVPIGASDIAMKVSKVSWISNKRQEVDGSYYYDSERKVEEVLNKKITTDKDGNYKEDLKMKDEGEYVIQVEKKDGQGRLIRSSYIFYVYGQKLLNTRQSNDTTLELIPSKTALKVGDTAELVIKSPYKSAKALIGIERGRIYEYKILDINQSLYKYSFPIKQEYIPNIYVTVTLLSAKPEIKYGEANFTVDTVLKNLDVDVKANKESYLPGEKVNLSINVKDKEGKADEAEVSIAVADLSVLALKGNPKKDPVSYFYSGFPLSISTFSNLKHALFKVDVPVTTKGGGGGDDLAKKKRGIFKDTAFWIPDLKTDKQGKAEISFTLPDNLTTWQIESLGVDKETRLGTSYQEFKTKKDVMVTALKPRFILPGDEFSVGAKVFNETDKTQKLDVSFWSETLELKNKDQKSKTITLESKKEATVYFKVIASKQIRKGNYVFALMAKNDQYRDELEESIVINKDDTEEQTATIGSSKENKVNEYLYIPKEVTVDKGGLTVRESATLAVFLNEGVASLFKIPDGTTQDISEIVSALSTLKKGLKLENVGDSFKLPEIKDGDKKYTIDDLIKIGIENLAKSQKNDGGFSYFADYDYSWFDLTLEVLNTFHLAKDAGYEVNPEMAKKAVAYIDKYLSQDCGCISDEYAIHTYFILNRARKSFGTNIYPYIFDRVKRVSANEKQLRDTFSNYDLSKLYLALVESQDIYKEEKNITKIYEILNNRLEIDSRGSFLPQGSVNNVYSYYSNEILNSALLIKALAIKKLENPVIDRMLLWIISAKDQNGLFGSSLNNIQVMDALIEYLNWKEENKANFNLKFQINGEEKNSFDFNQKTVFTHNILDYPIADFDFGELIGLKLVKTDLNQTKDNFYYDLSLKYFLLADEVAPRDEGFGIERAYFKTDDKEFKTEINEGKTGDVLKGKLKITVPKQRSYVKVESFIPAGVELVNFNLATTDQSLNTENQITNDSIPTNKLYPDYTENRDDRLVLFMQNLEPGEYEYDYFVRLLIPGKYIELPARVSEIYRNENFGRTAGKYFIINS